MVRNNQNGMEKTKDNVPRRMTERDLRAYFRDRADGLLPTEDGFMQEFRRRMDCLPVPAALQDRTEEQKKERLREVEQWLEQRRRRERKSIFRNAVPAALAAAGSCLVLSVFGLAGWGAAGAFCWLLVPLVFFGVFLGTDSPGAGTRLF